MGVVSKEQITMNYVYVLKSFTEGEDLVEFLNSLNTEHSVTSVWSTPKGVHAIILLDSRGEL